MLDAEDRDILIEDAASKLDLCGQISRKQALARGEKDEVCPLCSRVFLAHDTNPVVSGCHESKCPYRPPKQS
ncbi:MAG: hypothetical protein WAV25_02330 [Minisyncoccia bacterium]